MAAEGFFNGQGGVAVSVAIHDIGGYANGERHSGYGLAAATTLP